MVITMLCKIFDGIIAGNTPVASSVVTQASVVVNPLSTLILAANPTRLGGELRVPVTSVVPIYISFGTAATLTSRIYQPGDVIDLRIGGVLYTGAVYGIVAIGTQVIEVTEL